ncbi:unnamed protein product [Vicia faba]|uniref:hAT-like transposase RNase-H fold domain-containing protein n=1 Tax=Vicia faba TaxID=3906 RepID=A0AAV0ZZR8_VICFA|nr:unnamed protein product [Vicia faba]
MLESAFKIQKAFKRLSEKCADFVLMKGGIPNNVDWDNAKCFVNFLKIFFDITKKVSSSTFVTSSQYFNEHIRILTTLKGWIELKSSDNLLGNMAENMKVKYDKYWGDVEKMNKLIFVAVVLDPQHKMQFVRLLLGKGQYENPTQSSHEVDSIELKAPEDAFALEVNSNKYPILGQMTRDVLAMPVSNVASESAFSTGELAPIPQLNEGVSDIDSD